MKKAKSQSVNQHSWRFFRAGGFDQVKIDSGSDLFELENLDQKLWVALACPIDNVYFDNRTLSLIDTDGDRRIRANELIAAIKWTISLLKKPDDLINCSESLSISEINENSDEGKKLIAAARNVLTALGKNADDKISVADTVSVEKILSQKIFNGDGIITEDVFENDAIAKKILKSIISVAGAEIDRSGKPGINLEKVEYFFTNARGFLEWSLEPQNNPALLPLGSTTLEGLKVLLEIRDKINDYFARCEIADFDERSINALNGDEKEFSLIAGKIVSQNCEEMMNLPLARIKPRCPLSLQEDINPFWIDKISKFNQIVVQPLLGDTEKLEKNDWQNILKIFEPVIGWQNRKPSANLDSLDVKEIKEMTDQAVYKKTVEAIEKDNSERQTFEALISLEKLVRYNRDIYKLTTNFVNFQDFYGKGGPAIFQAGTLYLDQRSCHLCIKVEDINKHSGMASMAGTYLVYCECKRRGGQEKQNVVAAFTNGDSENLIVGRNGVFYDRAGNDWDATVTKIIENPISIRQAFWLPYKNLVRMIESQVAKRAMNAEAHSNSKLARTADTAANIDKSKIEPVTVPTKKLDIGIVAALGVAAGALGTFLATILGYVTGIIKLGPIAIIGAVLGLILLISGPSIVLAYIKLRKRNLGPILDAGGWAINAKAKINVSFGNILTKVAALPSGAKRDLTDMYADKKSPWPKVIGFVIIIYLVYSGLNHLGFINDWTNGRIGIRKEHNVNSFIVEKKMPQVLSPVIDK